MLMISAQKDIILYIVSVLSFTVLTVHIRSREECVGTFDLSRIFAQAVKDSSEARKTEGPRAYSRYIGRPARAKWPTFLPS
jgi:hypothetical protein